ncbi:alpha/beta fold hydrolase [Halovulum sp. GXIMD14793]
MPDFITSDGLRLHYEDQGAGKPILCLSGLTRNSRDFDDLAAELPPGIRLIRMDYRGRGQSDHGDWRSYQVPVEARDALDLLDHLGLDKVGILGTSRGGLIAMGLAATARDRLAGVFLNDIGPEVASGGLSRIMDYVGRKPKAGSFEAAAAMLSDALGPQFPDVGPDRWQILARRWYGADGDGLTLNYDPDLRLALEAATESETPDLWPFFDAFDGLPLAALRGVHSDVLSAEVFAEMQARQPHMIAATIPDRGHVPFLDEPESLRVFRQWSNQL